MNLDAALRDLAHALESPPSGHGRNNRLRAAQRVVASHCLSELGADGADPSIASVFRLLNTAPKRPAQRQCMVLLLHALAVRGLIPAAVIADICAQAEASLRDVLLRCGYPFNGSAEQKMQVLERLHRTIGELLQPLEPTFPNWQGLYAG